MNDRFVVPKEIYYRDQDKSFGQHSNWSSYIDSRQEVLLIEVKKVMADSSIRSELDNNEYYKLVYSKNEFYKPLLGMVFPKKVAIKKSKRSKSNTKEFEHEAKMQILAGKREEYDPHTNDNEKSTKIGKKYVPEVIGLDTDGYLYMELLDEYKELYTVIIEERYSNLNASRIKKSIIRELFIAITRFHHSKKLIHNDLKLENIMIKMSDDDLDDSVSLMVIDWGSATRINDTTNDILELPDKCRVTPEFAPLELLVECILKGTKITDAFQYGYGLGSDSWAVGAIIYMLLTSKCFINYEEIKENKSDIDCFCNLFDKKLNDAIQTIQGLSNDYFSEKEKYVFEKIKIFKNLTSISPTSRFGMNLENDKKILDSWSKDDIVVKEFFGNNFFSEIRPYLSSQYSEINEQAPELCNGIGTPTEVTHPCNCLSKDETKELQNCVPELVGTETDSNTVGMQWHPDPSIGFTTSENEQQKPELLDTETDTVGMHPEPSIGFADSKND